MHTARNRSALAAALSAVFLALMLAAWHLATLPASSAGAAAPVAGQAGAATLAVEIVLVPEPVFLLGRVDAAVIIRRKTVFHPALPVARLDAAAIGGNPQQAIRSFRHQLHGTGQQILRPGADGDHRVEGHHHLPEMRREL